MNLKMLKEAFDKIHLLENNDDTYINEEKILLDNDNKLVISKCNEFLDYVYSSKYKDKKAIKTDLIAKFNLRSETKSILGNSYYSVRFSQNKVGDEFFEGDIKAITILSINKVIDWSDKPLFNVVINTATGKPTVWLINLANIQRISGPNYARNGSNKFPDYSKMTGSINGGDLIGDKVTSANFEMLWTEQLALDTDTAKKNIFDKTIERNNRLKTKRKTHILDYSKLEENIDNTIKYMNSQEYIKAKAELDYGAELVYKHKDEIMWYDNGNIICNISEHIIRSRDLNVLHNTNLLKLDKNLADIVIGQAYIDIKVHYKQYESESIGGGKLMSIEKLIDDINSNPKHIHLFYNYDLSKNKSYLINIFDSEMINNYRVTTAWTGAGGLGHLTGVASNQSNKIDKEQVIEFFKSILGY